MNDHLDLTKILYGCEGITLYFTLYGECKLASVSLSGGDDAIRLQDIRTGRSVGMLRKNGKKFDAGECLLFPSRDQRDWSKFVKPFEDGSYVVANGRKCIFKSYDEDGYIDVYVAMSGDNDPAPNQLYIREPGDVKQLIKATDIRFAKQDEIDSVNKRLDDEGYEWNASSKKVEKLRWRPETNQQYHFILTAGAVEPFVTNALWKGSTTDIDRYKNGNCFQSKDAAIKWAERFIKVTRTLSQELKNRKD